MLTECLSLSRNPIAEFGQPRLSVVGLLAKGFRCRIQGFKAFHRAWGLGSQIDASG